MAILRAIKVKKNFFALYKFYSFKRAVEILEIFTDINVISDFRYYADKV